MVTVEYAPISWIDKDSFERRISDDYNWQFNVLFTTGTWLKAPFLIRRKLWNETERDTDQGISYQQQVTGIIPGLDPKASGEINRMKGFEYLLRIEDVENRKWLLGTLETPFIFSSRGTSGQSGSLKHHSVEFTSETIDKAFGFNPVWNV